MSVSHTNVLNARLAAETARERMLEGMRAVCKLTTHLLNDHAPLIGKAKDKRLQSQLARLYAGLPHENFELEQLTETLDGIVEFWKQQEKLYRE